MKDDELYLDENEKEVEEKNKKSDEQVADIWKNLVGGITSGFGGISLDEIAKGFELDEEYLGVDDITKLLERHLLDKKRENNS